jgi:hypothetical protein
MSEYLNIISWCSIRNHCVCKDGEKLFEAPEETDLSKFLTALYAKLQIDYRKFFKMDNLAKLGFLASEALLNGHFDREKPHQDMAVILFNRSASLDIDAVYQQSIQDKDNYFPSPSEFVYTLPNIMTGEIAIRNKIFGETACFISEHFNADELCRTVTDVFDDTVQQCLCGWVEYYRNDYEAILLRVVKETEMHRLFTAENIQDANKQYCR